MSKFVKNCVCSADHYKIKNQNIYDHNMDNPNIISDF